MKCQLVVLTLTYILSQTECAKILGVFPIPSVSHQVVYRALFKELHDRGHDVTVVTTDPIQINSTRYKQVDIGPISYSKWREYFDFAQQFGERKPFAYEAVDMFMEAFNKIFEAQMNQTNMQEFIQKDEHFDLIAFEWLLTPAYYRLVCKYSAPYVGLTSLSALINGQESVGNPSHPGYLPELLLENLDSMNYYERVCSLLYYIWFKYKYYHVYLPQQEEISRRYIPGDCPYIGDIENNVSLVLANTHPTLTFPRPNVPAMIEFGGPPLHMPPVKPLPSVSVTTAVCYCHSSLTA